LTLQQRETGAFHKKRRAFVFPIVLDEARAKTELAKKDLTLIIDLNLGNASATSGHATSRRSTSRLTAVIARDTKR
jgi:hypothetical protein